MDQQNLLKKLEQTASKTSAGKPPSTRGALILTELPSDMRLSIGKTQQLHNQLEQELGVVDLILTDNRRRMVGAKRRNNRHEIRIHHMFVGCDDLTVSALAQLAKSNNDESREVIRAYIDANRTQIRIETDTDSHISDGQHHDLQAILNKTRKDLIAAHGSILNHLADITITWGRNGRGTRSIRFGSFDFDQRLIRMHPVLDQDWIPDYFVEFIVYHELIHAVHPPRNIANRRSIHTPEFRAMEEQFPLFHKALAWEKVNLHRLLNRK